MKKNLLSVLILTLLIVNIVMSAIIMISVISTNSKTGALVSNIAAVMNLELEGAGGDSPAVPLSQTATYVLTDDDKMMVQLPAGEDGQRHIMMFNISLAMNTEHKDYEAMGSTEKLDSLKIQLKGAVESVAKRYTKEEWEDPVTYESIRAEILKEIQNQFQSDFIYQVSISDRYFQAQ